MDCADCALNLEEALRRTSGVAQVTVDFTLARLRLTADDGMEIDSAVHQVRKAWATHSGRRIPDIPAGPAALRAGESGCGAGAAI